MSKILTPNQSPRERVNNTPAFVIARKLNEVKLTKQSMLLEIVVVLFCIGFLVFPNFVSATWTCGQTLTDTRDSKTYATVSIGTQCWMAANLNVGARTDGVNTQGTDCLSANEIEKYCYLDDEASCTTYGGLYQWDQTMCGSASCNGTGSSQPACTTPVKGICPTGWHIPSHYEWTQLERAVCTSGSCTTDFPYDTTTSGARGTNEGTTLKTNDATHFSGLFSGFHFFLMDHFHHKILAGGSGHLLSLQPKQIPQPESLTTQFH